MSAGTARGDHRTAHPVSWLVGCVLVGWVIVYNILRFAGSTPAGAVWISLAVGGVLGAAAFGGAVLLSRRMAASGRVLHQAGDEVPDPAQMDDRQRSVARLAAPALAVVAAVALFMGVALGADWFGAESDDRATTLIILAAWNLLVAFWFGDEALRSYRLEVEGLEAVALGAALTAVLAGVGLSRDYLVGGQVALIVVAGIGGAVASYVIWRLRGARHLPFGAVAVLIVAALSVALPVLT